MGVGVHHNGCQFTDMACRGDCHQDDDLHGAVGEGAGGKEFEMGFGEGQEDEIELPRWGRLLYRGKTLRRPQRKQEVVG